MSTDVTALGLSVEAKGMPEATEQMERFARASDSAATSAEKVEKGGTKAGEGGRKAGEGGHKGAEGVKHLGDSANKSTPILNRLAAAAGTLVGSLAALVSINAIGKAADNWSDLQSRVGAAVKDMSAAPAIMQELKDMANATYSSLDQTVDAFAGNIGAFRDMGMGASEAMKYTEALNHALVTTATKGDRAASVQMHLAKAMDIGKLSGEGLDAVLANGGRVAQALAEKLNTTVGGLRKMSSEGKITSAVIAGALVGSLEQLRKEAAEMPPTLADGFQRISTNFTGLVGQLDQAVGASGSVANALLFVGDNLEYVAGGLLGVAAGATAYFIPSMLAGVAALALKTVGAISLTNALIALRFALVSLGIGAIVVGVGLAATAMIKLTQATGSVAEAWALMSKVASEAWRKVELSADALIASVNGSLADLTAAFWDAADEAAKAMRTRLSEIIGLGVAAYEGVMAAWDMLPTSFGELGRMAGAALVDGLVSMLKFATAPVDAIANTINAGLAGMGSDKRVPTIGGALDGLGGMLKNAGGVGGGRTVQDVGGAAVSAAQAAMGRDYLGSGDTAFGRSGDAARGRAEAYREASRMLDNAASAPMSSWEKLKSIIAGVTGEVTNAGAVVPPLGDALADAGGKGKKGMDEAAKAAKKAAAEAEKARKELMKTADNGANSLGEMFWSATEGADSFRKSVANILMEMAKMQAMSGFRMLFGGGGVLSGVGSLFGGLLSPNANGNVYQSAGLSAHSGTVVDSPTVFPFAKGAGLMGEAGPEAILPLKRGADGKLGVSGGSGSGESLSVVRIELGEGLIAKVLDQSGHQTIQLIQANNKTIPSIIEKTRSTPRKS